MSKIIFKTVLVSRFFAMLLVLLFVFPAYSSGKANMDDNTLIGIPFGGDDDEAYFDLCPQGVEAIRMFMSAWRDGEYKLMYELLDDESKKDYAFEDARLDFQFMEFKEYSISSARKNSDEDFEFILSSGAWRDGDKVIKKMIIDGESFKIIISRRGELFKESIDSYLQ